MEQNHSSDFLRNVGNDEVNSVGTGNFMVKLIPLMEVRLKKAVQRLKCVLGPQD